MVPGLASASATQVSAHEEHRLARPEIERIGLRRYRERRLELGDILRAALHLAHSCGDDDAENRARDLLTRLAADRFRLAVMGQFSRGKSTLMNALLGGAYLPMGALPMTSVITTAEGSSSCGTRTVPSLTNQLSCRTAPASYGEDSYRRIFGTAESAPTTPAETRRRHHRESRIWRRACGPPLDSACRPAVSSGSGLMPPSDGSRRDRACVRGCARLPSGRWVLLTRFVDRQEPRS
jgi:hypothetical protein